MKPQKPQKPAPRKPRSNAPPRLPRKPKQQKVQVVHLDGTAWPIVRLDLGPEIRGQIDSPRYRGRLIKISTRIRSPREALEVVLHEVLHGCMWSASEAKVERVAYEASLALYAVGARVDMRRIPVLRLPSSDNGALLQ